MTSDEERRKARREAGLYDRVIQSGRKPAVLALVMVALVALVALSVCSG